MAGGADDHGAAPAFGVVQHLRNRAVMGKINDHVGVHVSQFPKGPGHAVFAVNADLAGHLVSEGGADQPAHGAVGAADDRLHTCTPRRRISASSFARFPSSMGVRGRRIYSLPKPMALTAALAGMGFTSQNSRLMRFRYLH